MDFITIIVVFVVIFGTGALKHYWRHRERMAMIEKGLAPEPDVDPETKKWIDLYYGGRSKENHHGFLGRNRLHSGLVTAAVGLALTVGLLTLGIGPWLLGGLIPLFVGLAMLLGYFLSESEEAEKPADPPSAPVDTEEKEEPGP